MWFFVVLVVSTFAWHSLDRPFAENNGGTFIATSSSPWALLSLFSGKFNHSPSMAKWVLCRELRLLYIHKSYILFFRCTLSYSSESLFALASVKLIKVIFRRRISWPRNKSPSSRRRSPYSTRTAMAPSPPRSWEQSWGRSDRTPLRPSSRTWSTRSTLTVREYSSV